MSTDSHPQNGDYGVEENLNGTYPEFADLDESFGDMSKGHDDQKLSLIEWLNFLLPNLRLSKEVSTEDLRSCFLNGTVLCSILNKLCPGSVEMEAGSESDGTNVKRFLAAMDELALPSFHISDLEQGSMGPVMQCLATLRAAFDYGVDEDNNGGQMRKKWELSEVDSLKGSDWSQGDATTFGQHAPANGEETRRYLDDSSFQFDPRSPVIPDRYRHFHKKLEDGEVEQLGQKLQEVLLKQGSYGDLSDADILEFIGSYKFNTTTTQSLLDTVNEILPSSIQRKTEDIPNRIAYVMRKIMLEIEQRISNQANNLRNQNNVFMAREEKYQTKLRALETLALGTSEENKVVLDQLQRLKLENQRLEENRKLEEQDVDKIKKEREDYEIEISRLREELELTKKKHESHCLEIEENAREAKLEVEKKLNKSDLELIDSRKKVKELETFAEYKSKRWKRKERTYQSFMKLQNVALQELRAALDSTKQEVLKNKRSCSEEFNYLGSKLTGLAHAAENYHVVLAENRKLYNEVQDLKGNIRVYCRIRPFLPGQSKKQTTVDYVGENGELVIANPSKQGTQRLFKFNKVFGPTATQEEVFLDTQPLIRSVLDGYNVCIFAYGQTGSGKTYTMTGPSVSSTVDWGVNYRALSDLFQISQSRISSMTYEVGVQMVEIYNEQVRDLLSNNISQKRLGIWNTTQPNGLAVPDASMHTVKSTEDVLELMNIGLMNRAVGATALNERSSRSHSVLTVHVRGSDSKTDTVLRGSLHLVDLAGSERVDRSEATGERLREAQHINKSLSALGDVIFALAQKSSHVPYRNSKLTQVLQSSLGGQAKTLMFVQLNPDVESYSETISTLKFAERVSGVELGAARSNKEGRDVRELLEQVTSLKEIIMKKDEEMDQMRTNGNGVKRSMSSLRYGSASPRRHSIETPQRSHRVSGRKGTFGFSEKAASDVEYCSEYSEKHSESGSQRSVEDFGNCLKEKFEKPKVEGDSSQTQNLNEDFELLGFGDNDSEERLSDISDGVLSMGTETEGSISSVVEYTLFPEAAKPSEKPTIESDRAEKSQTLTSQIERTQSETSEKTSLPSKLPKPPQKLASMKQPRLSLPRSSSKISSVPRKASSTLGISSSATSSRSQSKRWQ